MSSISPQFIRFTTPARLWGACEVPTKHKGPLETKEVGQAPKVERPAVQTPVRSTPQRSSANVQGTKDSDDNPKAAKKSAKSPTKRVETDKVLESLDSLSLTSPPNDPIRSELAYHRLAKGNNMNWNFQLPVPHNVSFGIEFATSNSVGLVSEYLASTMYHGKNAGNAKQVEDRVWDQLDQLDRDLIKRAINRPVNGFPVIFYAAMTNNVNVIRRIIVEYGASMDAVSDEHQLPLLAFVIVNGSIGGKDSTSVLKTLLSLGAAGDVFPKSFYSPYNTTLPYNGPAEEDMTDLGDVNKQWCRSVHIRTKLAGAINITQRYYLQKSTTIPKIKEREQQVAAATGVSALLGIPYLLIGQTDAAISLRTTLLSHFLFETVQPLVLVFAGPSGHGKTELARKLSELLSLDMTNVDCTKFTSVTGMFGGNSAYTRSENGSTLNNFIADHHTKACVVFLDEFEKTTWEIHNALLKPFKEGIYEDRRDNDVCDTSRFIWVLATNALDDEIMEFCDDHANIMLGENDPDDTSRKFLMRELSTWLREGFVAEFGAPLAGRISQFIPFLPFLDGEKAIGIEKCLLELKNQIYDPVDLAKKRFWGDVILKIRNSPAICKHLADLWYDRETGMRSLARAVQIDVRNNLIGTKYFETPGKIKDGQPKVEYVLDIRGGDTLVVTERSTNVEEVLEDEVS
ncbi:hypothetical protein FKW77_003031 [Venturia effusa]|uniref:ATPase AAA-type core domain-containing protein n=1 Tax=Venturia effusa TaxID=50376 RepID=A0A517LID2_9PEZI|nr:hypothetical protein FKW77_003031 [Venturia effusa]